MRKQHCVVLKLGHVWQHSEAQPDGNSLPAEHPPAISGAPFCCRGRAQDSAPPAPIQGTTTPSPPPEAEIMVLVPLVICEVVLMPRSPPGLVSC